MLNIHSSTYENEIWKELRYRYAFANSAKQLKTFICNTKHNVSKYLQLFLCCISILKRMYLIYIILYI